MKSLRYSLAALLLPALMPLTGCSSDDEYIPVEPDATDVMGVYFDEDNPSGFIFDPESADGAKFTIKMRRAKCDGPAVDVPLMVECDAEGIKAPDSVHFDEGSDLAEIEVDCGGLPLRQTVRVKIGVPEAYTDHYAQTLFNYETDILVSRWEPANEDGSKVKFWFTDTDYNYYPTYTPVSKVFQPVESDMEVLPGAGRIRVRNFLNTGVDLTFAMTPSPYEDFMNSYRLTPMDNFVTLADTYEDPDTYSDPYYNAWFVYSDADDDYVDAELVDLEGNPVTLGYPMVYNYSDSYAFEYSWMKTKGTEGQPKNTATLGFSSFGIPNGITFPSYFYVHFRWDGDSGL